MVVNIKPNTAVGLAKAGQNALKLSKAIAAIEQIDGDIATIQTDNDNLAAADNAAVKAMVGRLQLAYLRDVRRQRWIIQFLMKELDG